MSSETVGYKADFKTAQANLRDTVKWLATIFSALAAFVVAGASVNGLGDLRAASLAFWAAALCLLTGFSAICWALYLTLHVLRPMLGYRTNLLDPSTDEEIAARKEIDDHAPDLLPHNVSSLAEIGAELNRCRAAILEIEGPLQGGDGLSDNEVARIEAEVAPWRASRDSYIKALNELLDLATFIRLKRRFDWALPRLFMSGATALIVLSTYAVLTHEKKSDNKSAVCITNVFEAANPSVFEGKLYPRLRPVLFEIGEAEVSAEGLRAIEAARAALRQHPQAVLLIRSHTDTLANMRINSPLAERRAAVVRDVLLGVGGISAQRVFVSVLPKMDLPTMTLNETPTERNRSVDFSMVTRPDESN